jgi:2'-deoxynucleoside 5'-phosphate N-hydrolase
MPKPVEGEDSEMRVYVSQAFSGATDWTAARKRSEEFADMLHAKGFEVYLPHVNTDPFEHAELDARTVFERDRDEINKSDILLALLDEPSHGVGAEIVFALNRGMVVLGAAADSKKISRFIIGLLEGSEKGHYIRYHRFEEVIEELLRQTEPRSRILSQIA